MYDDQDLMSRLSFTLWTLSTTCDTNYETWPTQHDRVRSVETPMLFFAVCGPKFTELSAHAQEKLQFATPFPFDDILFRSGDIRDQAIIISKPGPILMFLGLHFCGGEWRGGCLSFYYNFNEWMNEPLNRKQVKRWWRFYSRLRTLFLFFFGCVFDVSIYFPLRLLHLWANLCPSKQKFVCRWYSWSSARWPTWRKNMN